MRAPGVTSGKKIYREVAKMYVHSFRRPAIVSYRVKRVGLEEKSSRELPVTACIKKIEAIDDFEKANISFPYSIGKDSFQGHLKTRFFWDGEKRPAPVECLVCE